MRSCFFTGHRNIGFDVMLIVKTGYIINDLINEGVTDFYAGGALGWDMICEELILSLRKKYPEIKLHLILPCPPEQQTSGWDEGDRAEYDSILKSADDVEIISENYDKDCMKKRNTRLAELGEICLCYYNEKNFRSGTGQTVRMAQKAEKKIINVYDPAE